MFQSSLVNVVFMQNKVKEFRTALQITQQDLADAISVSRQTIFAIETSKYIPSTILALKIAIVLKMPVESVFMLELGD